MISTALYWLIIFASIHVTSTGVISLPFALFRKRGGIIQLAWQQKAAVVRV